MLAAFHQSCRLSWQCSYLIKSQISTRTHFLSHNSSHLPVIRLRLPFSRRMATRKTGFAPSILQACHEDTCRHRTLRLCMRRGWRLMSLTRQAQIGKITARALFTPRREDPLHRYQTRRLAAQQRPILACPGSMSWIRYTRYLGRCDAHFSAALPQCSSVRKIYVRVFHYAFDRYDRA